MKKIITLLLLFYSINSFSQIAEKQEDNTIYNTAGLDVKPEFPGGLDKLKSLINESYLKSEFASERKGKVYAMFVIEKDGSLSDVKILRGVDTAKANVLIQILKSLPKWNPGKQNKQIVRVLYAVQLVIGR
ncbi:energy transducer TonB [Flavobacterium paronense]|uniref:Energy transducer TonB n=1 Tax=Flavobacterium paronense TaxID=1392775 RepID=A0ABV5GBD3_9FLAO|nr:energy transducer TonB [Flavobacterium paronense]MDN3676548.1 energy transducer TonB [Flavobacterium paronense]